MTTPEYLPGDNLPLPSTPPQEPPGTFSPAMHTRWPATDYGYNPASGALRASAETVHTRYACHPAALPAHLQAALQASRMDPKHDHLNALLDDEGAATVVGLPEYLHILHPTRYEDIAASRGWQPDDDLRPPRGILYATLAGALVWVVVICLLSR